MNHFPVVVRNTTAAACLSKYGATTTRSKAQKCRECNEQVETSVPMAARVNRDNSTAGADPACWRDI